eukprot:UN08214
MISVSRISLACVLRGMLVTLPVNISHGNENYSILHKLTNTYPTV